MAADSEGYSPRCSASAAPRACGLLVKTCLTSSRLNLLRNLSVLKLGAIHRDPRCVSKSAQRSQPWS